MPEQLLDDADVNALLEQTFSDDGNTITGRWEIAEDGTNYATDFDLIYRRVDTSRREEGVRHRGPPRPASLCVLDAPGNRLAASGQFAVTAKQLPSSEKLNAAARYGETRAPSHDRI